MKKVFDWTIGSFFRTIGRIIAFLVVGGLIAYILADNDFRISELFFDNVKADTLNTFNTGGWAGWPISTHFGSTYSEARIDTPTSVNGAFSPTNTFYNSNTNHIQITGYFYQLGFDNWSDQDLKCTEYNQAGNCIEYVFGNQAIQRFTFQVWTGNRETQCQLSWNNPLYLQNDYTDYVFWTADCNTNQVNQIYLYIAYDNDLFTSTWHPKIGINNYIKYWTTDSSEIINNQNNNTQNIIQNQQNQTQQLLEDNTTQAESDSENFFGNFTVPDVGGLSAIVTAPLNTISSLLSSSCANLVLPLPYVDEDLTLPCMNDIYTEHFGLFFSLYQTIILAVVAYRCIRSIFFDIHGFTNPNDDRIEVIDL